jgi:hypothetical protein
MMLVFRYRWHTILNRADAASAGSGNNPNSSTNPDVGMN